MADLIHPSDVPSVAQERLEGLVFRLTRLAAFTVLIWVVLARRLFPGLSRHTEKPGPRRSIFRAAWVEANACVGFAFQSW